jgi:hypothetical protein
MKAIAPSPRGDGVLSARWILRRAWNREEAFAVEQ